MATPGVRHNLARLRAAMALEDMERERDDRRIAALQQIGQSGVQAVQAGVGGVVQHLSNRDRLKQAMDLERFKAEQRRKLEQDKLAAKAAPSAKDLARQRKEALERAAPGLAAFVERESGKALAGSLTGGTQDVDKVRVAKAREYLQGVPGIEGVTEAELLGMLEQSERGMAEEGRKQAAESRADEAFGFKRIEEEAKDRSRALPTKDQVKELKPQRTRLREYKEAMDLWRGVRPEARAALASLGDLERATRQADYAQFSVQEANQGGAGPVSAGASKGVSAGAYEAGKQAQKVLEDRLAAMVKDGTITASERRAVSQLVKLRNVQIKTMLQGGGAISDGDVARVQDALVNPFEDQRTLLLKLNDAADDAAFDAALTVQEIHEQGRRVTGNLSPMELIEDADGGPRAAFRFSADELQQLAAASNTRQQGSKIPARFTDMPGADAGVASPAQLIKASGEEAAKMVSEPAAKAAGAIKGALDDLLGPSKPEADAGPPLTGPEKEQAINALDRAAKGLSPGDPQRARLEDAKRRVRSGAATPAQARRAMQRLGTAPAVGVQTSYQPSGVKLRR